MASRWWTYQRERFPVFAHGALIAVFSLSAYGYSALVAGRDTVDWGAAGVAFAITFLFLLQLRIADEFKDFEDDSRFRAYRPVPRGLVTLRELAVVGVAAAVLQLLLAAWLSPPLLALLFGVWAYYGLMSVEFFAREWLKARPVIYLVSHMMIMPLIALCATACDWLVRGESFRPALGWFLAMSFFVGIALEIGRKIRAPSDEEVGVETYSGLWGVRRATRVWCGAVVVSAALLVAATSAFAVRTRWVEAYVVLAIALAAGSLAFVFQRSLPISGGKRIEIYAQILALLLYLAAGAIPILLEVWT